MAMSSGDIKQALMNQSNEFKRLHEEHQSYEHRLSQLQDRFYLSTQEEMEMTKLKKRKLILKDQMQHMILRYKESQVL